MKTKHISPKRKAYIALMRTLMAIAAILTGALVLFLIVYVLAKGIPNISWELLSTSPSYLSAKIGILPDILNTIYIVIATLVIVLPVGVGAAIYLTEYASGKKAGRYHRISPPRPSPAFPPSSMAWWVCCSSASSWICRPLCWPVP